MYLYCRGFAVAVIVLDLKYKQVHGQKDVVLYQCLMAPREVSSSGLTILFYNLTIVAGKLSIAAGNFW